MGAFFDSIHVRTENSGSVQKALEQVAKGNDCKFLMGPAINCWISVFPSACGLNNEVPAQIARLIPNDIFHLIVHDDDIFMYWFYRDGQLLDQYNSNPNYGDEDSDEEKQECPGRPESFRDLLRQPKSLARLKTLLAADDGREKFIFESDRMAQFAELLGLSNALASYDYLRAGNQDEDEIEGWEQFIHIESQPVSAGDYNNRGEVKLAVEDLDGALADFNKAVELDPNLVAARENLSRAGRAKNDRDGTLAATWAKYGSIRKAEGDLDGALVGYGKAIELNPEMSAAYNQRGCIKHAKGDLNGAIIDFNRAIELKPDFAVAYGNRGLVKNAKGDLTGAMADYNRAIELKPDSIQPHNSRGDLKRISGDWDGALVDFNRAIELKPDFVGAHNNRGMAKRSKGDLDGALIDFDRAIKLNPDSPEIYNNRAVARREKGDLDGALADINKSIELHPGFALAYANRGLVKHSKNMDGALADFDRAIELNPGAGSIYTFRGKVKEAKGDLAGATADFDKALELKPGSTKP